MHGAGRFWRDKGRVKRILTAKSVEVSQLLLSECHNGNHSAQSRGLEKINKPAWRCRDAVSDRNWTRGSQVHQQEKTWEELKEREMGWQRDRDAIHGQSTSTAAQHPRTSSARQGSRVYTSIPVAPECPWIQVPAMVPGKGREVRNREKKTNRGREGRESQRPDNIVGRKGIGTAAGHHCF
jgi:hypothetical protein